MTCTTHDHQHLLACVNGGGSALTGSSKVGASGYHHGSKGVDNYELCACRVVDRQLSRPPTPPCRFAWRRGLYTSKVGTSVYHDGSSKSVDN